MILDLFAGAGGWSQGIKLLGLHDVGIELDVYACATRASAGHLTIRADVASYPPGVVRYGTKQHIGLIASPPCQDFSVAGKRAGIEGYRGRLIYEVLRWTRDLQPEWIACEQVPPCLGIWQDYARIMRDTWGYHVWTGILNAADYGVPQIRKRAILMASRTRFNAPVPTHTERPTDDVFGSGLAPWVTMAEALGWGLSARPATTVQATSGHGGPRPLDGGGRSRDIYKRALKGGMWSNNNRLYDPESEPAPTVAFGKDAAGWAWTRPSTTVTGRPGVQQAPGWRTDADDHMQDAEGSIRVTIPEVSVLQSFPADYPWQGTKTRQFQQVGNAIPPLLAKAIVMELV